jgi:ketosteroid isomerase-like protein
MRLPCGFVVRKASKILPAFSGGSPTPVSVTDDGAAFFQHEVDDVDWTVMGTHPLAGHYPSKKAFIEGRFAKLDLVLPQGCSAVCRASSRESDTVPPQMSSD